MRLSPDGTASLSLSRRFVLAATALPFFYSHDAHATTPPSRYPVSWAGIWRVDRRLETVDGDAAAAETAWRVSGGTGDFLSRREDYSVRFSIEDEVASVADWKFEMCSRCSLPESAVLWDPPDDLRYERAPRAVAMAVHVEERIGTRTASNFGAIERWRVARSGGGGEALLMEVRRDYRPVNDRGNIEGSERIRTYSTLDLEVPTSTSRSSLTLRALDRQMYEPLRRPTWDVG